VNGLAVVNLKIAGVEKLNLDSPYDRVRGILGENLLDQFDLLIDNQNRQITLDATANLANSYDGDRLKVIPISHFSGRPIFHRPIVTVTVPSYSSRPLRLVLDTGAAALAIFPHRAMGGSFSNGGHARFLYGSTPNGNLPCAAWKDTIHWDKSTVRGVDILSCRSATAEELDSDGSMPTHLFTEPNVMALASSQSGAFTRWIPSGCTQPPAMAISKVSMTMAEARCSMEQQS